MYRLILVSMLSLSIACFGEEDSWIQQAAARSDPEAVAWLKDHLKGSTSQIRSAITNLSSGQTSQLEKDCSNCMNGQMDPFQDPQVFAFMSFSIPDATWISLSNELEKVGGIFVLRGLPNQSFRELADKIFVLKEKGVNVPIQLDPQQFQIYQLTSVPTFVVPEGEQFDKVTGNVSLKFALELMAQKGETSAAKLLYQLLVEAKS